MHFSKTKSERLRDFDLLVGKVRDVAEPSASAEALPSDEATAVAKFLVSSGSGGTRERRVATVAGALQLIIDHQAGRKSKAVNGR